MTILLKDPAIDIYEQSSRMASDNLRKLITEAVQDPSFDLFSFAHLLQQDIESGNPLHSIFTDKLIRAAKISVRASELMTEALASMIANMPIDMEDDESAADGQAALDEIDAEPIEAEVISQEDDLF